ncbi:hypothetical protein [Roseomonas sp. WA12]
MNMNSIELRETLARIEAQISEAGDRLNAAEAAYSAEFRAGISHGDSSPPPVPPELNAARDHLSRLGQMRSEARSLLAAAEKQEKLEADDAAREKICAKAIELQTASRLADEATAALIGHLRAMSRLSREVGDVLTYEMKREAPLFAPATHATSKLARFVENATKPDAPALEAAAEQAVSKFIIEATRAAGG